MLVMKLDMRLRRFAGVMFGVRMMGVGEMGVMGAGLMIALGDMGRRFAMVLGGAVVVLGGLLVVLGGAFGVRHPRLPMLPHLAEATQ
jgi:hypothetical protein